LRKAMKEDPKSDGESMFFIFEMERS